MKTPYKITRNKISVLAVAAVLLAGTANATSNSGSSAAGADETLNELTLALQPVTPVEANFEDGTDASGATLLLPLLPPAIPAVADFEDELILSEINLQELAPVTPAEAVFEER